MSDLTKHFALLKELESEHQEIEAAIETLMAELESVQPELRSVGEWSPTGRLTQRFIELSARQNEVAAEITLVSAAIESAKPANSPTN